MQIRRLSVVRDTLAEEGGLSAFAPVTRVAACAVILNPYAGKPSDDLALLVEIGGELGAKLVQEAVAQLPRQAVSYGKAAIVGVNGDIEHAAAILHPRMGKPMRAALAGGQAIIPSTKKISFAGDSIDVPLGQKDDVWSFDHIDTLTVNVAGAPRPNEIVVIVALSDGGRARPRVNKDSIVRLNR
jgi:Amino acid synthesis